MNNTVADLMRRSLLDVFNEPDPERRSAAIAQTYAEEVVWHEPDRVVRGREALAERATELRAQTPDTSASGTIRPANRPLRPEWTSPTARTASRRALHLRHRSPSTLLDPE
jgi:hypothetical protein